MVDKSELFKVFWTIIGNQSEGAPMVSQNPGLAIPEARLSCFLVTSKTSLPFIQVACINFLSFSTKKNSHFKHDYIYFFLHFFLLLNIEFFFSYNIS